jgi:hypothetical protein
MKPVFRKPLRRWVLAGCAAVLVLAILAVVWVTVEGQGGREAKRALTDYLNHISDGQYEEAYEMLSDFDKGNVSEASFVKWQQQVARISKVERFAIDNKVDTFKNYKYLGTEFGTVYGLKVDREQKTRISGIELVGYDKDSFRIMVQAQQGGFKVLLLLTQLDDTIAAYDAYLAQADNQ